MYWKLLLYIPAAHLISIVTKKWDVDPAISDMGQAFLQGGTFWNMTMKEVVGRDGVLRDV